MAPSAATPHIADDVLEQYSLGRLAEDGTAPVEAHLLVCAGCRDRLAGWDEYHAGMKAALRELQTPAHTGLAVVAPVGPHARSRQ